ncbi:MAG: efflux RND transporter periplasmic adaptor subunit [Rhodocyclaceae bacterium]|nr:efflux RND transporter periplasmic adaptor subunit [Rhodocyclaceae bacterium]MBX3670831.1 efflux RND transporter periplasmic adaptor subunit [Rhodocyclaceae bacterium]
MPNAQSASGATTGPHLKPRVRVLAGTLVAAACATLAACSGDSKPAAQGPGGPPQALPVTVLAVQASAVPLTLEQPAQAEGQREVEVRARVSGILEKRLYDEGQVVKAGQQLFRIERAPFEIALAQARAQLAEIQARAEQSAREAARLDGLVAERAISQREFDDAKSTAAVAKANVSAAEAAVRQAELNLSYTRVEAPVAGLSGRAQRSEGTLVGPGADSLLTSIVQIDPIWVRFSVSEGDLARLGIARPSPGAVRKVELMLPDGSVYAKPGRINFTANRIDAQLGTLEMRAEFANPQGDILPGQFVRVRLTGGMQKDVFLVPQAAVMQSDRGTAVMLANDKNEVAPQPVTAGQWVGKNWVITGGLKAGDRVIVDNLMKLRPGAPVAPHAPDQPPAQSPQPKS